MPLKTVGVVDKTYVISRIAHYTVAKLSVKRGGCAMPKCKPLPSLERLREVFELDRINGRIFWKERKLEEFASEKTWKIWHTRCVGKEAGSLKENGYRTVPLDGKARLVHRVIFELANNMVLGEADEIDHRDGNPRNNEPYNLRIATSAQNARNSKCQKSSRFGLKGVRREKRGLGYSAIIYADNKHVFLGMFKTPEDAHAAYAKASRELHGEFGRAA